MAARIRRIGSLLGSALAVSLAPLAAGAVDLLCPPIATHPSDEVVCSVANYSARAARARIVITDEAGTPVQSVDGSVPPNGGILPVSHQSANPSPDQQFGCRISVPRTTGLRASFARAENPQSGHSLVACPADRRAAPPTPATPPPASPSEQ